MVVGIQYCGGCNPRYNRTAIVEKLQKEFPSLCIYYVGFGEQRIADLTVVIAGCDSRCTLNETPAGRLGKFIVTKPEDYTRLAELIFSSSK